MIETKQQYRQAYRTLRRLGIDESERRSTSQRIISRLRERIRPQGLDIALYMAMADEPDISPLLEEWQGEARLYLPRVEGEEEMNFYPYRGINALTQAGKYQIFEPNGEDEAIEASTLDIIIVPAIAFDHLGYRLGRGKGYYDRYLAKTQARTIGVTLSLMPIERLPHDPWDIPMDEVLR